MLVAHHQNKSSCACSKPVKLEAKKELHNNNQSRERDGLEEEEKNCCLLDYARVRDVWIGRRVRDWQLKRPEREKTRLISRSTRFNCTIYTRAYALMSALVSQVSRKCLFTSADLPAHADQTWTTRFNRHPCARAALMNDNNKPPKKKSRMSTFDFQSSSSPSNIISILSFLITWNFLVVYREESGYRLRREKISSFTSFFVSLFFRKISLSLSSSQCANV